MLNFFNIKWLSLFRRPLILAYGDTTALLPSEAIYILAPSDYWVMRVELFVKTPKEAVQYGPGLFELSESHRYEAQKVGDNSYIILAYDPEQLSKKLNALPNLSQVEKITFAQWVFAQELTPISLNNSKFLTTVEGIVIEIDTAYVRGGVSVTLAQALEHPKFFLKTLLRKELVPSAFTSKTLKTTLIILIILLGNLSATALFDHQESSRLQKEMQETLKLSKLPETSIQREAILAQLKTKETKQLYFRHQYKKISDIPIDVTKSTALPLPPILASSSEGGIVLIPGSMPNEANRLLIENSSNAAPLMRSTLLQEIRYEGSSIMLIYDVRDSNAKETLKKEIIKRFKKVHINERDAQLEVRLP
ncbi:MAG: hypothetical protein Q8N32_08990 [Sulfuricurvum sp.]|nr:hypothetical protein [Sulfuricurvum sp.]